MAQRLAYLPCVFSVAAAALGCSEQQAGNNSCTIVDTTGRIAWSCTGPSLGDRTHTYDGWATVERSTTDQMVVYVSPGHLTAGDTTEMVAEDEAGGAHCSMSQHGLPLPTVPVGSRVWLHESLDTDFSGRPRLHDGPEISVHAGDKDAVVLLDSFRLLSPTSSIESDALVLDQGPVVCEQADTLCQSDGRRLYYDMVARADEPVTLRAGVAKELSILQQRYTLGISRAWRYQGEAPTTTCADFLGDDRLYVDASMCLLDASSLIEGLASAPLPACAQGNDPGDVFSFGAIERASGDVIQGEVTYRERQEGNLLFDVVDSSGTFYLNEEASIETPSSGQRFWLDFQDRAFVLREGRGGAIIIAALIGDMADPMFSEWLTMPVDIRTQCAYEKGSNPRNLYEAVLGDEPQTHIAAGRSQELQLDGHSYRAWFSGVGSFPMLVIRPGSDDI